MSSQSSVAGGSITPGTGSANLGKAEDAAHASGDVGVFILAVANEALATFAADGDYTPVAVDRKGRIITTESYLSVVDQIDNSVGPVLNAAVNTIQDNAGTFLAVVASLAAACKKIRVADTTGAFIGVYTGAPAAETLAFIINPGQSNEIEHAIPAGTRITLRNMAAVDIIEGELAIQFLG